MISNFLVISAFFATRQAVAYHLKRIGNVFFWLGVKNFTGLYKSNLAWLFRIFSAWSLHSFSDSIYWEKNASDEKDILQKLQTITTQTSSSSLIQSSKNIAYYLLEIIIAHSSILRFTIRYIFILSYWSVFPPKFIIMILTSDSDQWIAIAKFCIILNHPLPLWKIF